LGFCGPSLAWLITQRPFPDVFAKAENGFVPPEFCFVAGHARNMIGLPVGRREPPSGSRLEAEAGRGSACGAARAGVDGFMPRIALYPGSFDPVTNGHLDVVRHAVGLCDRLIVAIGVHSSKKPLFSAQERLDMARAVFSPVAAKAGCTFDCTTYDNLTVAAAQKHGASIMIRGLRDGTDLDFEMQIAGMNETMAPGVHTVFVPASAAVRPITATLVRQIAAMGGDVSAFVPPLVAASLKTKFAG
jgi:pantetheine-phosphate adenylyltransferase